MTWEVLKGNPEKLLRLLGKNPVFVFAMGNTRTAEVPGITVAGANPDLIRFTPPADAELLYHGRCKVIPFPPATPDGKPTPALITYTALKALRIPYFIVDCGFMVKPHVPHFDIGAPVGGNIVEERAMKIEDVRNSFEMAEKLGGMLSEVADILVIGESIPAGTTTAGAVLKALGVEPDVSSSMPANPVELKQKVISKAVERVSGNEEPLEILSLVGDPVLVGVAGLVSGAEKPVMLAGGTQMSAVARVIRDIDGDADIAQVTTVYVAKDRTADLVKLSPDIPVIAVDPGLDRSSIAGLRAYSEGFVKEGVGAGGAVLLAFLRGIGNEKFLYELESNYMKIIGNGRKEGE